MTCMVDVGYLGGGLWARSAFSKRYDSLSTRHAADQAYKEGNKKERERTSCLCGREGWKEGLEENKTFKDTDVLL